MVLRVIAYRSCCEDDRLGSWSWNSVVGVILLALKTSDITQSLNIEDLQETFRYIVGWYSRWNLEALLIRLFENPKLPNERCHLYFPHPKKSLLQLSILLPTHCHNGGSYNSIYFQ